MPTQIQVERTTGREGCGGVLVSLDGVTLPLRGATVSGQAGGGLARIILKQTFANTHAEPLNVTYAFPLPADGAVSGYEFRIGERRVVGQIDRREDARQRFEKALIEGRTAGLLDEERTNLFTQQLGNVPPGQEVAVELTIDQPLRWLSEGMWEWRFPTVVAPRYLGAEGRVPDEGRVTLEVAGKATGVRASLNLAIQDPLPGGAAPESTSHLIRTRPGPETTSVTLAQETGAGLDRDLVVRWPVARPESGLTLRRARPATDRAHAACAYGLLTMVPPEIPQAILPRDLILLLDTSGSMNGRPLALAKRVAGEMVASLGPADRLEMISFSSEARRWRRGAVEATDDSRSQAIAWIEALHAGGGTEMTRAVEEALRPLRAEAQRQVVLVTDGQIGFEEEVFRAIRDHLPPGSRFHAVGVGTAVNRALLEPAARAGRGVEVIIDLDDAPDRGVARLLAATRSPILCDVEIAGSALTGQTPRRLPDLLMGAPLLASVRLRPEGGDLTVRARSAAGAWTRTVSVPATGAGEGSEAITALYGRGAVKDLELDRAAGADPAETDHAIESLGLAFGLATRLTSWVAISEEPTVDPRQPVRVTRIPQELPYGLSAEGLGLRSRVGVGAYQYMLAAESLPAGRARVGTFAPAVSAILRRAGARMKRPDQARRDEEPLLPGDASSSIEPEPTSTGRFGGRWMAGPAPDISILEFEVDDGLLPWDPGTRARLIMRAGNDVNVEVLLDTTTQAGRIEPGMAVRVALRMAPHLRTQVRAVEVAAGTLIVRIDL